MLLNLFLFLRTIRNCQRHIFFGNSELGKKLFLIMHYCRPDLRSCLDLLGFFEIPLSIGFPLSLVSRSVSKAQWLGTSTLIVLRSVCLFPQLLFFANKVCTIHLWTDAE
jgi:hypothetical protein